MLWQAWWVWIVGGVVLAAVELLVPGYIFLGFALGAAVTGALVAMGVPGTLPLALLMFAGLSLASWAAMRALLGRQAGQAKVITRDINDN